jgi:hypothetical protein
MREEKLEMRGRLGEGRRKKGRKRASGLIRNFLRNLMKLGFFTIID